MERIQKGKEKIKAVEVMMVWGFVREMGLVTVLGGGIVLVARKE